MIKFILFLLLFILKYFIIVPLRLLFYISLFLMFTVISFMYDYTIRYESFKNYFYKDFSQFDSILSFIFIIYKDEILIKEYKELPFKLSYKYYKIIRI